VDFLFYFTQHVLPSPDAEDEDSTDRVPDVITELDSLVQEMKIREMAKRSIFSIPMQLAEGFTIGVKGSAQSRTNSYTE
jgi:ATP-dependent DNA helicase 2 subunit 1